MSYALQGTDTTLARALAPELAHHPGQTGIYPLSRPRDAFAARVLLVAAAQRSVDVQYYMWHGDTTGNLLFEALWQAAERGVRVRLLLDDNNTGGLDETLAALDAHANIEVRLYNPLVHRRMRWVNYVTDFIRINHRMHNKSLTVDNQVTIVGGRNIGDEYFAAGHGTAFEDLDVIAVGPVVNDVSRSFDSYWNSESAYPVATLLGKHAAQTADQLKAAFAATHANPQSAAYLAALRATPLVTALTEGHLAFEWARAQLLSDDPAKTLDNESSSDGLLLTQLLAAAGRPTRQFDLVSPYFVPKKEGTAALAALVGRGVRVRVLTNSLRSNDVGAVHAGYAKRRKDLLRAGVQLYELKRAAKTTATQGRTMGGSSSASLHAKTFQLDGQRLFVGSFNFDPRSAKLNTEMGLLIESPVLARQLETLFDAERESAAYTVRLTEAGCLQWTERTPEGQRTYDKEPQAGALQRGLVRLLSILPIDWLL